MKDREFAFLEALARAQALGLFGVSTGREHRAAVAQRLRYRGLVAVTLIERDGRLLRVAYVLTPAGATHLAELRAQKAAS